MDYNYFIDPYTGKPHGPGAQFNQYRGNWIRPNYEEIANQLEYGRDSRFIYRQDPTTGRIEITPNDRGFELLPDNNEKLPRNYGSRVQNGYRFTYDPSANKINASIEYGEEIPKHPQRPNFQLGEGAEPKYTGPYEKVNGKWRTATPTDAAKAEVDKIAEEIDRLFKGKFVDTGDDVVKAFNTAKGVAGSVGKRIIPFASDYADITAGWNRLRNAPGLGGRMLGVGQTLYGLGGMGLSALELAGAIETGGASILAGQGAKALGREALKSVIEKLGKKEIGKMSKSLAERAKLKHLFGPGSRRFKEIRNISKLADKYHNNLAVWGIPIVGAIYDMAAKGSNDIPEFNLSTTKVSDPYPKVPTRELEDWEKANNGEYEPIQNPNTVNIQPIANQQAPKGPMEQFIRDRVSQYGLNAGEGNEVPIVESVQTPEQLDKKRDDILKSNGYSDQEIEGFKNGTVPMPENVKQVFDNTEKAKSNNIQALVDSMGQPQVGQQTINNTTFDPEYLEKLLGYYDARRNLYNDYMANTKKLANDYMDNWWLDYQLKSAKQPIGNVPTVSEALAKKNDLMKQAADTEANYYDIPIKAIANYKLASQMGLPLGSELGNADILKQYSDLKKNTVDNTQKLMIELMKMQNDNNNKQADRIIKLIDYGSAFEREQFKQWNENLRADLRAKIDIYSQEAQTARENGKIQSAEKLRMTINNLQARLKAADVLSYANTSGVADPALIKQACEILGYPDITVPTFSPASNPTFNLQQGGDNPALKEQFDIYENRNKE